MIEMTHDEMAEWAAKRLRKMGYPLSFANMTASMGGEQPDVLGLKDIGESILIEVKVSRADFLKDKKKPWRAPGQGIGKRRVYLTPKGLLKPEEIPYGWELWEVHGNKKPMLKIIKGMRYVNQRDESLNYTRQETVYLNCDFEEYKFFSNQGNYNYQKETMWLFKIIRRMEKDNIDVFKYANGKCMDYNNK